MKRFDFIDMFATFSYFPPLVISCNFQPCSCFVNCFKRIQKSILAIFSFMFFEVHGNIRSACNPKRDI